ncbi:MAG: hypothetical protein Greene041619_349 [Candidatus Peregrinibacteria bacterium Greene0416_19]|nr:MAG: hypothetical protein Greene041619_349 [Candidatus Peregrinibacteria bacterium Greene0416_19]
MPTSAFSVPFLTLSMSPIDPTDIQKKCEEFLASLGIPGFIIFGWKKDDDNMGIVYSYHDVPINAAIKGVSWALHDFISKTL